MSNQPVRGNAGGAGNNQPPAAGNNQPPGAAGPAYTAEQLLPNILNIVSRQGFNSNLPRNSLRGVSRATKEEYAQYNQEVCLLQQVLCQHLELSLV